MAFNIESAMAARAANHDLTVFDTGEMLEPTYGYEGITSEDDAFRKTGLVDFDNDSSETMLTVFAHPSSIEDDTIILNIDSALAQRLRIVVNDGDVATIETDGTPTQPGSRDGEPTVEQYARFGRMVAAQMGANEEWDSAADYLQDFGDNSGTVLGVHVGSEDLETLAMWRGIADELGIEHDGEEEDDERECDSCGDIVEILSSRDWCDGCEEEDAK